MFGALIYIALVLGAGRIQHHDPNIPCCDVKPAYAAEVMDANSLQAYVYFIELNTGRPWVVEFTVHWLDCHPYNDPWAVMDVNKDGMTDLLDFALLSRVKMYYGTDKGERFHVMGCRWAVKPLLTIGNRTPCSVCIGTNIATEFLKGN